MWRPKVEDPPSNSPVELNSKPEDPSGASGSAAPDDTKLRVTGLEPAKGDTQGGTYVVLRGARFIKDGPRQLKVYFGSRQGSIVRFQSDSEVIVQAPGGKPNEVVDVLLVFDPGGQLKLPQAFTFVDLPTP